MQASNNLAVFLAVKINHLRRVSMERKYVKIVDLMNTEQVAHYLGVSKSLLEKMRCKKAGVPYHKISTKVVYVRLEVEEWFQRQRQVPVGHSDV